MYSIQYLNGETEAIDNLENLTEDQRSDIGNGVATLLDEEGNEVELPEATAPVGNTVAEGSDYTNKETFEGSEA